ncbi:FecCD family ABC transporter permease [Colwellia sp. MEBiC06753]
MHRISPIIAFAGLMFFALISLFTALAIGSITIDAPQLVSALLGSGQDPLIEQIIWQLRMPRTLLAFIAGGGLAVAGLILQTVTRNPLADPYLFGISSGAAVGVVVFITLSGAGISVGSSAGISTELSALPLAELSLSVAALLGGLVAMALLLMVSGSSLGRQVESMLLAGVALSFLFSALTSVLLYWSDPQAISAVLFWTMGSFARAQWTQLWLPALLLLLALMLMIGLKRHLTALLLGDESAITLGLNVRRFRWLMLLLSSVLTASLVAVCGGIGFVGLMIPHLVRLFVSQAHGLHTPLVAVLGGSFMVWVDIIARSLLHNQELPVGVITGLIGSVFFLSLMLVRQRKYQES